MVSRELVIPTTLWVSDEDNWDAESSVVVAKDVVIVSSVLCIVEDESSEADSDEILVSISVSVLDVNSSDVVVGTIELEGADDTNCPASLELGGEVVTELSSVTMEDPVVDTVEVKGSSMSLDIVIPVDVRVSELVVEEEGAGARGDVSEVLDANVSSVVMMTTEGNENVEDPASTSDDVVLSGDDEEAVISSETWVVVGRELSVDPSVDDGLFARVEVVSIGSTTSDDTIDIEEVAISIEVVVFTRRFSGITKLVGTTLDHVSW